MIGNEVGVKSVDDPNGYSALECYFMFDSQGKHLPCRGVDNLNKVIRGKKSWNLQVKLWAEDMGSELGLLLMPEELHEYCNSLPSWIEKSVLNQAKKIKMKNNDGYCPSYILKALENL
jgi:hypothetical protein